MTARIAITGAGAICAVGADPAAIWEALRAGRSGVGPVRQWDGGAWTHRHAAEIADYDPRRLIADRKALKLIGRTHVLGIHVGTAAIGQAGWLAERAAGAAAAAERFNDRSGIYVAAGSGAYHDQYDFLPLLARSAGDLRRFGAELAQTVPPMWLLQRLPNNVVCHLGLYAGFTGPHACVVHHNVGGVLAVAEAAAALRAGAVDRAIAVGHEAPVEPQTLQGLAGIGVLARRTLRPFDAERDGYVLGEGAAALALERYEDAVRRGAARLGEVLGSAATSEGGGLFELAEDGDGLARAIELALADANCGADAVALIVAHGDGTHASDVSEARAIRRVFGTAAPPVTACKWATGHLGAAAAPLEALMALAALRAGTAPGIATLGRLDEACAPLPASAAPQAVNGEIALVLCRGFAGTNAALLLRVDAGRPA